MCVGPYRQRQDPGLCGAPRPGPQEPHGAKDTCPRPTPSAGAGQSGDLRERWKEAQGKGVWVILVVVLLAIFVKMKMMIIEIPHSVLSCLNRLLCFLMVDSSFLVPF